MPFFLSPQPRILWNVLFDHEPVWVDDERLAAKCRALGFKEVEPASVSSVEVEPPLEQSEPVPLPAFPSPPQEEALTPQPMQDEAPKKRGRPRKVR